MPAKSDGPKKSYADYMSRKTEHIDKGKHKHKKKKRIVPGPNKAGFY
jgi:hypothetical protein